MPDFYGIGNPRKDNNPQNERESAYTKEPTPFFSWIIRFKKVLKVSY